jgi:carbon-monoxide dehydrogenase large subunit
VLGIDTSRRSRCRGRRGLFAADLDLAPQPPSGEVLGPFERPILACEVIRFVGEPVAVVLAESAAIAEDAAELVAVELDPLDAVLDAEAALEPDSPLLFPEAGTNLAAAFEEQWEEDVLAGAEVVAHIRVRMPRLAPVPMEANAVLAVPGGDPLLTLWVSTQIPFDVRNDVAEWLGLERADVRVVAPDVGGDSGRSCRSRPSTSSSRPRRCGCAVPSRGRSLDPRACSR